MTPALLSTASKSPQEQTRTKGFSPGPATLPVEEPCHLYLITHSWASRQRDSWWRDSKPFKITLWVFSTKGLSGGAACPSSHQRSAGRGRGGLLLKTHLCTAMQCLKRSALWGEEHPGNLWTNSPSPPPSGGKLVPADCQAGSGIAQGRAKSFIWNFPWMA